MEPKYLRIAKDLEQQFPQMLSAGTRRLPSEAALTRQFSCSRQTVRAALEYLRQQNRIIKQNGSGSFIADGYTPRIAVLLPSTSEYIYPRMLRTIDRFFREHHYEVTGYSTEGSAVKERRILEGFLHDPPAGIILCAARAAFPCICEEILQKLSLLGIPLVYLGNSYDFPSQAVTIASDVRSGAYKLVDALSRQGYRRILGLLLANDRRNSLLYAGAAISSMDHGLSFEEENFRWLSREEYKDLQRGLYELPEGFPSPSDEPSVILCGNDEIAYHMTRILQRDGYRVPEDIGVAGYDNSYFTLQGELSISSVGSPDGSAATEAARALFSRLTGHAVKSRLLPMQFYPGQSTSK